MFLFRLHTATWGQLITGLLVGIGLTVMIGCQSPTDVSPINQPTSVEAKSTPTDSPEQTPTIEATSTPSPTSTPGPITLRFWTVEEISPLAESDISEFFQASMRSFERSNPDIEVEVSIRKAGGKGGILDYLRTAGEVAPSILPDVAIIDASSLEPALVDNLLQGLDGRLDRSIVRDLLPAARRMGTVNDTLAGVPIGIDMEHTVYNTQVFTETPVVWTDLLSKNTPYLFPARGVNGLVNDATLSQYFSAGGELLDSDGNPKIDDHVLLDVLEFYRQAVASNIISSSVLEAATTEELWPRYLEGEAGSAQISVRQNLTDRDLLTNTAFGPPPRQNPTDIPVAILHGWVLVLITDDINRQDAALRLMESFLSPAQNATWNELNKSIPVRDTVYRQLAGNDPYWEFLAEQLNTAQSEPGFTEYDRMGRIIQQAVEQVIRGESTPNEATATALDALAQ